MHITARYLANVFTGAFVAFVASVLGIAYTQNTFNACQNVAVNVLANGTCQEYVGWHTFSTAVMWISIIIMVMIVIVAYVHRSRPEPPKAP